MMEIYREGDLQRQLDLMSPFSMYYFLRDPSAKTAFDAAYMPVVGYLGMRLAAFAVGESLPGFWGRAGHSLDLLKQQGRAMLGPATTVGRTAAASTPFLAAAAIAVPSAILYEKHVNEPIRAAHGGARTRSWFGPSVGTWFGPFASGFGRVV